MKITGFQKHPALSLKLRELPALYMISLEIELNTFVKIEYQYHYQSTNEYALI